MTDVESSTRAWDASPKAARHAIERHNELLSNAVARSRGHIVELGREGDSVLAVFKQATDAVICAVDMQRALQRESWPAGAQLRIRVAIHTGEADVKNGHYIGVALYRCARLMAAAHGGQIVVSKAAEELAADGLPEDMTMLDLGQQQLRDLSRPEHVYQVVHPDLPRDFPPLRSIAALPNNLPNTLTTFVGRKEELSALTELVRSSRMVTLTGTGGVGKSRLAIEVAKAGADLWPAGRWWIELTAVDDVADALVARLELPGRGPALEVVTSWLAAKKALLILDNCEHKIDACAHVCESVLASCPDVAILATSREPLGVVGEARWPLAALREKDALALFEARGRLVRPSYKAEPQAKMIGEICRRLDRLPLAIEMAAARLDVMSESELLEDLKRRLGALASSARTFPERQQTMRATIDWGHRLLTLKEADLFRRLGVFQGGFTVAAVEAVALPGTADVIELLTGLVRKSMVVADSLGATTRYRLLDSHHSYALEKLEASGETDETSARHYGYFSQWVVATADARARARESANLWAALAWAHEHSPDRGLALAVEVADIEYSDHARARALLLDLLDHTTHTGPVRAKALNLAARLSLRQGYNAQSRELADASVAAAREIADPALIARTLSGAGIVYVANNDLRAARAMYDEALSLLETAGDTRLAIETQNQLAVLATLEGNHPEALALLERCVAFSRAEGDDATTARYLESAANSRLGTGDVAGAARDWREALSLFRDLNDPFGAIWSIGGLALVAAARGDGDRTVRLAAVADRFSREWSLSAWPERLQELEKATSQARTRIGARRATAGAADGAAMDWDRAIAYALEEAVAEITPSAATSLLSRREREVAAMVAAGMTNREIAHRLFLSERTIEGHVEHVRNKLDVRSRTEVATWAVTQGLVPRES